MGFLGLVVLCGAGLAMLWVAVLWVGCAGEASAMVSSCWFRRAQHLVGFWVSPCWL